MQSSRSGWHIVVLPALVALVLAAAASTMASASSTPEAAVPAVTTEAYGGEASAYSPAKRMLGWLSAYGLLPTHVGIAVNALLNEQEALSHPSVKCQRVAQDPDADDAWKDRCERLQEQFDERPILVKAPGLICRAALADPVAHADIAARCEAWLGKQGGAEAEAQAGPAQQKERPGAAQKQRPQIAQANLQLRLCHQAITNGNIEQREECRRWLASLSADGATPPHETCRRVLNAKLTGDEFSAELQVLVERCRAWAAAQKQSRPALNPSEVCPRVLAGELIEIGGVSLETLIERCEAWAEKQAQLQLRAEEQERVRLQLSAETHVKPGTTTH
jgi:hypothetical protein